MQWNRFGAVLLMIGGIILFAVIIGVPQYAPTLIATSMIATTLRVAAPLTLGALSGIFCERAGVVNIAIEGMMLMAAFFGFLGSIYTNQFLLANGGLDETARVAISLGVGVVLAIFSGAMTGLLHAVLSVTYKVDQIISGTVINILAVGITGFLNRALFFQGSIPHAPGVLPIIKIPVLSDLPVVGPVFQQQPIAVASILFVFIAHFVLFYTRWGLRTRSVGEHPRAADTLGINVIRMRYANVIIGGCIAGLAGAYFTLESVPSFEPLLTNGRGFIALAAMIFGNWNPFGAWAAALLFGSAQALQINAQAFGFPIPSQFIGMLPYILTMIAMTGIIGRTTPPAADGQAYSPGG
ncbi:MAG: ABC transporter permease [Chloroflexota bacterium]|nr:MAG: ABC transporter permease [Chloroflexota bacterium]